MCCGDDYGMAVGSQRFKEMRTRLQQDSKSTAKVLEYIMNSRDRKPRRWRAERTWHGDCFTRDGAPFALEDIFNYVGISNIVSGYFST